MEVNSRFPDWAYPGRNWKAKLLLIQIAHGAHPLFTAPRPTGNRKVRLVHAESMPALDVNVKLTGYARMLQGDIHARASLGALR